jgi:predicted dehydrogenase
MELYGEDGTVFLPDPNFFGGNVVVTQGAKPVKKLPRWEHPFSIPNQDHPNGRMANYRTAGLADMALAIADGRPHRCSLELSLHAIEVLTGILRSSETGRSVAMQTTCKRPAALGPSEARALQVTTKAAVRL